MVSSRRWSSSEHGERSRRRSSGGGRGARAGAAGSGCHRPLWRIGRLTEDLAGLGVRGQRQQQVGGRSQEGGLHRRGQHPARAHKGMGRRMCVGGQPGGRCKHAAERACASLSSPGAAPPHLGSARGAFCCAEQTTTRRAAGAEATKARWAASVTAMLPLSCLPAAYSTSWGGSGAGWALGGP